MRGRLIDIICPACKLDQRDQWLAVGDYPSCPKCGTTTERLWSSSASAHGDECDITIQHGWLGPDDKPCRYTSKSEIAREAKARGLVNHNEHIPQDKGTDKSRFTSRWI